MKNKKILFITSIVFIILLAFIIQTLPNEPLQEQTLESKLTVSKSLGFNVEGSKLDFGKVPVNGSATKSINITNSYPFDIQAKTTSKGNITPFLNYKEKTEIKQNTTKPISITAKAPNKTEYKELNKNYTGNVTISLFRKGMF